MFRYTLLTFHCIPCIGFQSGGDTLAKGSATISAFRASARQIGSSLPGTATERLNAARDRARSLDGKLIGDFAGIRKQLLWAAGLADISEGEGRTSHCFSDWNHVAATTMQQAEIHNKHNGSVKGMAVGNYLGSSILAASLHEGKGFEQGNSWCTCAKGAPEDIAHVQFKSEVAFYLVWLKGGDQFALVTEQGEHLACGHPSKDLPTVSDRKGNWLIFESGADAMAKAALECSSAGVARFSLLTLLACFGSLFTLI